ncbi:MAG: hypothetical protein Q9217_006695 [Psora testacea]
MCIALFSTAHPDYALILINNRDEFLTRPTLQADWWTPPHSNILGGRDLLRPEQGTWLGITREGRIAVLTNFREEGVIKPEVRSRGAMVNAYLMQPAHSLQSTEKFVRSLVEGEGLEGIGGFSLVCGRIGEPLAVISNRTPTVDGITWIAGAKGETTGLSNTTVADRSWTKVTRGEQLMADAIENSVAGGSLKDRLIERLFNILSDDTLPRIAAGQDWESKVKELRKSIFIPAVGGDGARHESAEHLAAGRSEECVYAQKPRRNQNADDGWSGAYGTQKQTVVLVTHTGKVTFVERTLYHADGRKVAENNRDRFFEFGIER